jgi:hypothetical protein
MPAIAEHPERFEIGFRLLEPPEGETYVFWLLRSSEP